MKRAVFNGSMCYVCAACFTVGKSYQVEGSDDHEFKVVDDHDKFWWVSNGDRDFTLTEE